MRLRHGFIALICLALAGPAFASFHAWHPTELFTSADGSVQFIELHTDLPAEYFLNGVDLVSKNGDNSITHTFTFPHDSLFPTNNHHLLIATDSFALLPGSVTPDYAGLPANFLFADGGTLQLMDQFQSTPLYAYGPLPTDGVQSRLENGTFADNSPTNFAGAAGSIVVPEPATVTLLLSVGLVAMMRRSRR